MFNGKIYLLLLTLITVCMINAIAGDGVEPNKKTIKSDFELTLDFGRVCKFGKISWSSKQGATGNIIVTTSSLGISVWGGFWGAKWSAPEAVSSGDDIFSAAGKQLKLNITVLAEQPLSTVPLENLTVEYRPVSEPNANFRTIKSDIKRFTLVSKPISHIALSDKVATPHIKWGKPFSRGKVKVLFLTHLDMQRELLELNQRMDIEFDAPTLIKYWYRWSLSTFYREKLSPQDVLEELQTILSEKTYDVIVVGGIYWSHLPESIREKLKNIVNNGTGLVLCLDPREMGELEQIAPMGDFVSSGREKYELCINAPLIGEEKGRWVSAQNHFITTGIPFEFLPETFYYKYTKSRSVFVTANGDPILALGRYGQGKIVQFSYSSPDCWGGNCALTPAVDKTTVSFPYWEYYLSLLGKSILWAAGKEPEVAIKEITPSGQNLKQLDKKTIILTLENTRASGSWLPPDPVKLNIQITFRDEFFSEERTITQNHTLLAGETQKIEIPIPADLKVGIHFADAIIFNGKKIENWGTAYFKVVQKTEIAEIKFDKEIYSKDDQAAITVNLSNTEAGLETRLNLYDTYDRLVATYNQKADGKTVVFKHQLKNVLSHFIRVKCELIKNEQLIDIAESELAVAYRHLWDDYEVIVWGFTGMQILDYLIPYYYPALRDFGTTALLEDHSSELLLKDHARANFTVAPIGIQRLNSNPADIYKKYKETNDKNILTRTPCLSDPNFRGLSYKNVKDTARKYGPLGPVGYCMGDENSLTTCGVPRRHSPSADICFSEFCINNFHDWLKGKYGSLEKLNAEWGSEFKQWDEVLPSTKEEMRATKGGNYSSWTDHREFMDDVWAETPQRWRKALQEKDQHAGIGISGTGPPSAYTGFDYWKLVKTFDYFNLYRWISQGEIWSSFLPDKNYTHWAGYGQSDKDIRYGNWWSIVNKHRGISYFKIPFFVNPDLTLTEHAVCIRDSLKDIKEGIGRIAITSEKLNDGIAILYSQSSLRAAWVTGEGKPRVKTSKYEYHEKTEEGPGISWDEIRYIDNMDMYCMLLKGAGLSYKFISYEQVAKGELSKYKALILPYTMSLSSQEAEAIKKFVKDGGLLIADIAPAVMDGNCKTLNNSSLSDVFGAEITGLNWSRVPGKIQVPKTSLQNVDFEAFTMEDAVGSMPVKVTTGKSLGKLDSKETTTETVIVNNYGKGKAVFLNFFLSHLNDTYTGHRDSQLLSSLLKTGGVTGRVRIVNQTKSLPDYETAVFKNGPVEYLTILRGTAEPIQEIGNQNFDHKEVGNIEVVLPKDYYIYNVRGKKFEGHTNKVICNLITGDAAFYALLPYEIDSIQIKTNKNTYITGQLLHYSLKINAKGKAQVGNHVVRLEVYGADGKLCSHYSKNILTNAGRIDGLIPLALNEKAGVWKIKARDVASGKTVQTQIELSKN